MNIREIRDTHQKERQKDSLQHLDDTFYEDVGEYIEELHAERKEAAANSDDPFGSHDVQELTDTIETVEQAVESLYERRMGKIVKKASFAAAGMQDDIDAATNEERELFESLVGDLEDNRENVLSVLDCDSNKSSPVGENTSTEESGDTVGDADDKTPVDQNTDSVKASGSSNQADGENVEAVENTEPDMPRQTVQITSDVGEIFGVDEREYELREDDVVKLPEENATVLLEKDAAATLD